MNIKELMKSVKFEDVQAILDKEYPDSTITKEDYKKTFDELSNIKPTFDYFDMIIELKRVNGSLRVTNTHLGSVSDLAGRRYKVDHKLNLRDIEIASHCLYQIVAHCYDTVRYKDNLEDWDENMMNPQKARIVR